jgi:ankyrin repeat protein
MSLLAKAVLHSKTMNETIKFLLEYKFDLREVVLDDTSNMNLFLYAVENGNTEFIKYLLSKDKTLINSKTLDGKSGLYIAVSINNYEVVELLINNNIDISIKFDSCSPLRIALEYNVYLIEYAYYNNINEHDDPSKLFKKIEMDELKFLDSNKKIITKLLDMNAQQYENNIQSIMTYAFEYNNLEAVLLLFNKSYNITVEVNKLIDGKTMLDYSIIYKNVFITKYKYKLAPQLMDFIYERDMKRNIKIVEILLKKNPSKKTIQSAIKLAQKERKPAISRILLEFKAKS